MASTSHRGRTSARRASSSSRRGRWLLALLAAAAFAGVGALIASQTVGGSTSTIPERVTSGEGRTLGDPNAPVTVVEYADFQCPICKGAETSIVSRIEQDYVQQGKVQIEFRMFPFIGQESWDAAQASEAAADQGKFWQYHDALFNAQGRENGGSFSYDKLVTIAQQAGLDVPQFEATLSSNTHLAGIQAERDAAVNAGVASTPTFFIGDKKIVGAQSYGVFQSAIDAALAKQS